jgi:hypothetical protein
MKSGLSISERQRLDAHLNRRSVFTGSWHRMSVITSDGKLSSSSFGISDGWLAGFGSGDERSRALV